MNNLRASENFFCFFDDAGMCVWDVSTGDNYVLDAQHGKALIDAHFSGGSSVDGSVAGAALLKAKLLVQKSTPTTKWGWSPISRFFHFATRNVTGESEYDDGGSFAGEYVEACKKIYRPEEEHELRTEKLGERTKLPPADMEKLNSLSLWDALQKRKTSRHFFESSLSLNDLSTMLYAVFAETHADWDEKLASNGIRKLAVRKTSPSGGGIHPTDVYVISRNVQGLKKGVYFYSTNEHALVDVRADDLPEKFTPLLSGQDFAEDAPVLFVLVCRFDRLWKKYKQSRAYRVALYDIGHLSQTFHLCAAALNLDSWLSGAFNDHSFANLLKLDVSREDVMFVLVAGHGNGDFVPTSVREALSQ